MPINKLGTGPSQNMYNNMMSSPWNAIKKPQNDMTFGSSQGVGPSPMMYNNIMSPPSNPFNNQMVFGGSSSPSNPFNNQMTIGGPSNPNNPFNNQMTQSNVPQNTLTPPIEGSDWWKKYYGG